MVEVMSDCNELTVVCVGANLESLVALEYLCENGAVVSAVVISPAREEVRGSDYRDLSTFCSDRDIECITTLDINSSETVSKIKDISPDLIFILGWSQLFCSEIINTPTIGVVGSHPSRLPYGAGRAPVPWTVLEGLTDSAVTLFEVTEEVDAGPIYLQEDFSIPEGCSASDVYRTVSNTLGRSFLKIYKDACKGELVGKKQCTDGRTVRAKRTQLDGFIDFNKSANEVMRLVRAVSEPFPGAFSYYDNEKVTFWRCLEEKSPYHKGAPGQILKKMDGKLLVQCADKPVWLYDLSNENASVLEAGHFKLGERFGYVSAVELYELKKQMLEVKRLLREYGISDR